MSSINKEVNRCEARGHERSPPPIIVFGGKVEIAQQNGRFRTCNNQNYSHFIEFDNEYQLVKLFRNFTEYCTDFVHTHAWIYHTI